jgi:peptide/nickel transport system permease protein
MRAYVLRRLLEGLPILVGVTLFTFLLFEVFGGDPAVAFLGKHASAADLDALRRAHGLDLPAASRYFAFVVRILTGDLGRSFVTSEPVADLLVRSAIPSLLVTVPALFATTVLAVAVALVAAHARGRALDRAVMIAAVVGMSVSFLVYILIGQFLFAFEWPLFPIYGYEETDPWPYVALPILILIAVGVGYDARFYRAVMVAEASRPYVDTARAKGIGEPRILVRHVLRNAMIPIVTRVMISVPFLVTGSVLLESFYGVPGLGGRLLEAIDQADLPVIEAYTVLVSVLFVASNTVTDVLYALFDPRVKL